MSYHHLSSSRLGGCAGLHVRSPGGGASLLGVKAGLRKSCGRRGVVTCAKTPSKSDRKTEESGWGLKLWGSKKKAAVANGKSPAVRGTQQIRRPKNAAKNRRPGPGDKARGETVKAKQNAANCLKDIAAAEKQLEQLKKSSMSLGERAAALQARAREAQSVEKGVAAGAVAAERAVVKVQKDLDLLKSKADDLAKQEAAARAVLSAMESAAMDGKLLTKQEQNAAALPILQPELAQKRAEAEQKRAELAERKAALAVAKASPKMAKAGRMKVQMPAPAATKVYVPPPVDIEDLEAKAGEAKAKGDVNQEAKLRAQAASEARREATDKAIAERAAKLEADQRAREAAAEDARKAILAEARLKAQAAAVANREGAAKKKMADAAKQKAKAEAQREAQRAAQEKERQKAEGKAKEAAKKQADAKAKAEEKARKAVADASAKAKEAVKKKAAEAKSQAQELKKKSVAAAKAKPGGFKWPWQSASAPEPAELVERRVEAQEWISNWQNGVSAGDAQKAQKKVETSAKAVEAKPKVASGKAEAVAANAKRPASAGFKWPWAPAPEPEELVQRRKDAQEWIDNWKAKGGKK